MNRRITSRRLLPWSAPLVVAGVVVATVALSSGSSSAAAPDLAPITAQHLLAKVQQVRDVALSGVVHESAALGLPDIPGEASSASLSWASFITGSHDAKVWLDGAGKQRIALLGQLSEAEVVHNGRDVWTYTSNTDTVTHTTLPAARADRRPAAVDTPEDPTAVAGKLLKAIDPSTVVSIDDNRYVSDGHAAYTLTLSPKNADSTVHSVRIAVDAATFVPLQVQIFGADSSTPAFEVGFSQVSFHRPAASAFRYAVPKGATVSTGNPLTEQRPGHRDSAPVGTAPAGVDGVRTVGSSWTTVLQLPAGAVGRVSGLLRDATSDYGTNGARLLHTALVNVLIQPDGTAWVGAVTPAYLASVAH